MPGRSARAVACARSRGCELIAAHAYGRNRFVCLLLALPWLSAPPALAQSSAPAPSLPAATYQIAAEDDVLWLARVAGGRSSLVRRERGGAFDLPREASRSIAAMIAADRSLFAVYADGAVYRYRIARSDASPERDVPNHRTPLGLSSAAGQIYALLPAEASSESAAQTAARIAAYDGRDWRTVATCEVTAAGEMSGRKRSRMLATNDFFVLAWCEPDGKLRVATRGRNADNWTETTAPQADLSAFWLETVNVTPTLVGAAPDPAGGEKLLGWRLSLSDAGAATWTPLEWRVSAPPAGGRVEKFESVVGFNQQLAALAADEHGAACLLFARDRADPSETALDVAAVFEAPIIAARRHELVRFATFFLLILLVIGMFAFRRDSMTETFALPRGMAIAFSFQRLLANTIDITPFAWSAALACDVDPIVALRELSSWGLVAGADTQLPSASILTWWILTASGFTIYCGVMEALLGRTIGKLLAGTRVVGQQGRRLTLAQSSVRNAMRLVELIPQFWIFAFLIVLSRNHQRLGDVFARTVVVRSRASEPAPRRDNDPDPE